jgi:VanZ family protein
MASLIILMIVLAAALMPAVWFWDDKVSGLKWIKSIDKWAHGVTFFALSLWFTGLYHKSFYWRIGIGLLAFGLVIEACQRLVIYRTAEWMDVGADAAGIILGLVVGAVGIGGWCQRAEDRFARQ